MSRIHIARIYDREALPPGRRFLVDRLWPRGVRRDEVALEGWLRDVAPSDGLRRWFGHDVARWPEFRRRYRAELADAPDAVRPLLEAAEDGDVVLLYAARDADHNNAVVLREHLLERLDGGRAG
ncbi:DUF488 domain-containing protein [Geodermatophilus sp. URMC 64]